MVLTMADASLFRVGVVQRYLNSNKAFNGFGYPENAHFIGTVMGQVFGRSKFASPTLFFR